MVNRIREIAGKNQIKISQLIARTGLSKSYIYDVMNGKSVPSILVAQKIAKALNSNISEVFPEYEI